MLWKFSPIIQRQQSRFYFVEANSADEAKTKFSEFIEIHRAGGSDMPTFDSYLSRPKPVTRDCEGIYSQCEN